MADKMFEASRENGDKRFFSSNNSNINIKQERFYGETRSNFKDITQNINCLDLEISPNWNSSCCNKFLESTDSSSRCKRTHSSSNDVTMKSLHRSNTQNSDSIFSNCNSNDEDEDLDLASTSYSNTNISNQIQSENENNIKLNNNNDNESDNDSESSSCSNSESDDLNTKVNKNLNGCDTDNEENEDIDTENACPNIQKQDQIKIQTKILINKNEVKENDVRVHSVSDFATNVCKSACESENERESESVTECVNNLIRYDLDCECLDYVFEMLYHDLKKDEETFYDARKFLKYEKEQKALEEYRQHCVKYIYFLYQTFGLSINTLSLSIDILYRLMGELHLTQTNATLVAFTVLSIAAKYHENDDSRSKARILFNNVISSEGKLFHDAALKLEMQFLEIINFRLTMPSVVSFADHFISLFFYSVANVPNSLNNKQNDQNQKQLLQFVRNQVYATLEQVLFNKYTLYLKPSVIAAICVKHVMSLYRFGVNSNSNSNSNNNKNDASLNLVQEAKVLDSYLNVKQIRSINQSKTGQKIAGFIDYFAGTESK